MTFLFITSELWNGSWKRRTFLFSIMFAFNGTSGLAFVLVDAGDMPKVSGLFPLSTMTAPKLAGT